jgi:steroid 5-alpha reductase family enzyme
VTGFDLSTGLQALALICALAFATWLASLRQRDVSIVDGMWPVFIASGGAVFAWSAPRLGAGALAALVLLAAWALRLCIHITVRNHGQPEDRRYQKIRANHQPRFELKSLYIVFGFQALLAWVVSLPFMAITAADAGPGAFGLLGLALAALGLAYESIADWQLQRFRAKPASHGRVLDTGLWRYSRHPNYFGECCVWWGFGCMAAATGGWWTLASPLLMTVLLLKVSGVSLLERDIGERRPEYARYLRTTNAFLPGNPRPDTGGVSSSTQDSTPP